MRPRWRKQREGALRGWIKSSDGRLYHPVVAEKAIEAWKKKQSYQSFRDNQSRKGKMGAAKRWSSKHDGTGYQNDSHGHNSDSTGHAESMAPPCADNGLKGEGQGQGQKESPPFTPLNEGGAEALNRRQRTNSRADGTNQRAVTAKAKEAARKARLEHTRTALPSRIPLNGSEDRLNAIYEKVRAVIGPEQWANWFGDGVEVLCTKPLTLGFTSDFQRERAESDFAGVWQDASGDRVQFKLLGAR